MKHKLRDGYIGHAVRFIRQVRFQRLIFMGLIAAILVVGIPRANASSLTAAAGDGSTSPVVALFLALSIVILASRVAGAASRKLGQPRVLGELIVGVILGPSLLNMLHWGVFGGVELEATIKELAELGVLLLMFNIGLEVHLDELAKVGLVAIAGGVAGVLVPVVLGALVVIAFGFDWSVALFAGVTLAATSVSISAQVLFELGVLRTKVGNALLATALIDDVLAIIAVSLTLAITVSDTGADLGTLIVIVLRMAVYMAVAFLIAWYIVPRFINWVRKQPELSQFYGAATFALILALFYGWSSEALGGVAAITGAFIAGVGLTRVPDRETRREINTAVSNISYVFLVPIFFVSVGLETDLSSFPWAEALPFAIVLLIAAVLSKVVGCGVGARLTGFNNRESLQLGVCMVSRGEVGLIIASLGLTSGVLTADGQLFSVLFLVILLTTVMTPPLVRLVFSTEADTDNPQEQATAASTGD